MVVSGDDASLLCLVLPGSALSCAALSRLVLFRCFSLSILAASITTRLESFDGRFASRLSGTVSRLHDLDRRRGSVSARPATDLIWCGLV